MSKKWHIFKGNHQPHDGIQKLQPPPPWRKFGTATQPNEKIYTASEREIDMVNAALLLRRPLLVTGKPGTGKTSLAKAVAHELQLGPVLVWPITSRSTLQEALYRYDAIGRLQAKQVDEDTPADIGAFIRLGPLGTALLPGDKPRVLLIDEIDKSDIDLPNDLLHIFEEGSFEIPELARLGPEQATVSVFTHASDTTAPITRGKVVCRPEAFPLVILTSNEERELPPAFLRRCLRLDIAEPSKEKLAEIVQIHLGAGSEARDKLIAEFLTKRDKTQLATDQLLNAIYLTESFDLSKQDKEELLKIVLRALSVG